MLARGHRSGHFSHHGGASFHSAPFHPHARIGIFLGAPVFPSWYYPYYMPPAYAYPPVPSEPPLYIEQEPGAPAQPPAYYYCPGAGGYYPGVRECPEGWEQVPSQPPPS